MTCIFHLTNPIIAISLDPVWLSKTTSKPVGCLATYCPCNMSRFRCRDSYCAYFAYINITTYRILWQVSTVFIHHNP